MDCPHEEVRIVFLDHFGFEPLAKFGHPFVAVLFPPCSVCLPHFPIGAEHCVTSAIDVPTSKLIAEVKRYFFQRLCWRFLEESILR